MKKIIKIFIFFLICASLNSLVLKKGQTFTADQDYTILSEQEIKKILIKIEDLSNDCKNLKQEMSFKKNSYELEISSITQKLDLSDTANNKIKESYEKEIKALNETIKLEISKNAVYKKSDDQNKILWTVIGVSVSVSVVCVGATIATGYLLYITNKH